MRKMLGAVAVTLAASGALAQTAPPEAKPKQDWRTYDFQRTTDGKLSLWMIDVAAITSPTPDTRLFTTEAYYEQPEDFGGSASEMISVAWLVDCTAHTRAKRRIQIWGKTGMLWDKKRKDEPERFDPEDLFGEIAGRACGKGFDLIEYTRGKTRMGDAAVRFGERRALLASIGDKGWRRAAVLNKAPGRVALYYAASANVAEPEETAKLVDALVLFEKPQGDATYMALHLHVDCAAKTVTRRLGSVGFASGKSMEAVRPTAPLAFDKDDFGGPVGTAYCERGLDAPGQSVEAAMGSAFAP